jgi:hypothetical protein
MSLIKNIWEDLKAFRRGERRVAPHGVTGRVYAKRNPEKNLTGGGQRAVARATITIKPSAVIDASGKRHTPEEWRKLKEADNG